MIRNSAFLGEIEVHPLLEEDKLIVHLVEQLVKCLELQLALSASRTAKEKYRLPVTCSDFNSESTTVNSHGLDFIDLPPVIISISYRYHIECGIKYGAICDR